MPTSNSIVRVVRRSLEREVYKETAGGSEDAMKAFLSQSLLIGAVIVAVGCTGPQSNMSFEERVRAAGYPSEYIDGLNAGSEAFCRELLADKVQDSSIPLEVSITCRNLAAKVEQKPKMNRSHQQGWADGKALGSFAMDAVRRAEAYRKLELQGGFDYMKYQRNMELLNLNK